MNQENKPNSGKKTLPGILLALVLAIMGPIALLTELSSLMPVVMLSGIGIVFLDAYAGKAAMMVAIILQLCTYSLFMGSILMWVAFFSMLLPALFVARGVALARPFGEQMKLGVTYFLSGLLIAVVIAYAAFGSNMVDRVIKILPEAVRSLPEENLETLMNYVSSLYGSTLTVDRFYQLFDNMATQLASLYRLYLPGILFSGSIVSAVISVSLGNWIRKRRGTSTETSYLPVREWAIPSSMTGGLLLMLAVSYLLWAVKLRNGQTVYYTIYNIAVAVFCIQAFASIARHLKASNIKLALQRLIIVLLVLGLLFGGSPYLAIYGCASAIFGSRGAIRQRAERNNRNSQNKRDDQ